MNASAEATYSVVDLFAGAGGLSYGFLQTGRYIVKAAFENNRNAQRTYKKNHGDAVIYDDVADALKEATKEKLGHVDVVIGGPPCQGFSNANRQKNHAISKNNSLVKKFVQTVLFLQPTAFIMENVGMLQSETHRFYVDEHDREMIARYGIKTSPTEIHLLDDGFLFEGVAEIVSDMDALCRYRWNDSDYLSLNIVYKMRQAPDKLKEALNKHKKKILSFADRLIALNNELDHILHHGYCAGLAIRNYYAAENTSKETVPLIEAIEPSIMFQRMLSKAREILDNRIVVTAYSTEHGLVAQVTSMAVIEYIKSILGSQNSGYSITEGVLSAASFGTPQKRMRFVMLGVRKSLAGEVVLPTGSFDERTYRTVRDAIGDIEDIDTVTEIAEGEVGICLASTSNDISNLASQLRDSEKLYNHVSTESTPEARQRFEEIEQGGNFHSLPPELKSTYSNTERTQNTIYLRLKYDEPSGTVVNVRKSMWIHPVKHRALSIREAARLQSFPDSFIFCGTKDSQYQQVGNAVPPILAKALAEHLCAYLDRGGSDG